MSSSCRIVVVSSTLEGSRSLANRIKALSGDIDESDSSSDVLHWTIKNKYYTAPVHFQSIHLDGLESIDLDDVPAVIYTWSEREPYKEHIKKISEFLSPYEPEVSLAINTTPSTEEELEDFFFEHGFEYIDGHNNEGRVSLVSSSNTSDTPGIHRAIDALSTIMWPSMTRIESSRQSKFKAFPLDGLSDVENSEIDVTELLDPDSADFMSQKQSEMKMLEEWLNADVCNRKDADEGDEDQDDYASLYSHEPSTMQSNKGDPWSTGVQADSKAVESMIKQGFDDDFTEFVSAPIRDTQQAGLKFEGKSETDLDLPSEDEIRAASARIFGPALGNSFSTSPFLGTSSSSPPHSIPGTSEPPSDLSAYLQLDDDETVLNQQLDMDGPAFDLSRIFGALQSMKEEIALIPDEQERRSAAAKVALGLVYGLEGVEPELDH